MPFVVLAGGGLAADAQFTPATFFGMLCKVNAVQVLPLPNNPGAASPFPSPCGLIVNNRQSASCGKTQFLFWISLERGGLKEARPWNLPLLERSPVPKALPVQVCPPAGLFARLLACVSNAPSCGNTPQQHPNTLHVCRQQPFGGGGWGVGTEPHTGGGLQTCMSALPHTAMPTYTLLTPIPCARLPTHMQESKHGSIVRPQGQRLWPR